MQAIITFFPILASPTPFPTTIPRTLTEAGAALAPLAPALVLCTLFFSSTLFTEMISKGKYPTAYAAYQRRVGMFIPLLTPVWGVWLSMTGGRAEADALVYGSGKGKRE